MNFLTNFKVTRVLNAVAAGTSSQNGSVIDMQGYEGVAFVAAFGTLTATQVTSLKAQEGDASNLSDAADLEGTSTGPLADGDSNKLLVLEVFKPLKRYIRPVVVRGTANAVIDGVIAIQWAGRVKPETQGSNVAFSKTVVSPSAGTA